MAKFLGGDFPAGTRLLDNFGCFVLVIPNGSDLTLNNIVVAVETVTEQNKQKVLGKVGWGIVGGLAFGPLGMLAGVVAGGNRKEVCVICHLGDGRSFMATVSGKVHQKLLERAYSNSSRIRSVEVATEPAPPPVTATPLTPPPLPSVADIFLGVDGEQSGPFTYDEVYKRVANDELPPQTVFWKEGMTEWRNVNEAL